MSTYTQYYSLDKYEDTDRPNLRDQYNAAMDKIDTQLHTQDTSIGSQATALASLQGTVASHTTQIAGNSSDITALQTSVTAAATAAAGAQADIDAFAAQPYTKTRTSYNGNVSGTGDAYHIDIDRYVIGTQGLQLYVVRGITQNVLLSQWGSSAIYTANLFDKNTRSWPVPFNEDPAILVSTFSNMWDFISWSDETNPSWETIKKTNIPGVSIMHVGATGSSHDYSFTIFALGTYATS